jgi:hypothetical protein
MMGTCDGHRQEMSVDRTGTRTTALRCDTKCTGLSLNVRRQGWLLRSEHQGARMYRGNLPFPFGTPITMARHTPTPVHAMNNRILPSTQGQNNSIPKTRFRFNLDIVALNGCKFSDILYCFGYFKNPHRIKSRAGPCSLLPPTHQARRAAGWYCADVAAFAYRYAAHADARCAARAAEADGGLVAVCSRWAHVRLALLLAREG